VNFKKKSIFLLCLFFHGIKSFDIVQTIKDGANSFNVGIASPSSVFCDSYQLKIFGWQDVSADNKTLIHGILNQLGIKQYNQIHIKQMSPALIKVIGSANALATANAIFIDEQFFNSLSQDEQVALIGHEGIHIKNKHVLKTLAAICLAGGVMVGSYVLASKIIKSSFIRNCLASGIGLSLFLGLKKFTRYNEELADKESANILNCHKATQQLLQRFVQTEESKEESNVDKVKNWFCEKFAHHPLPEKRIAYLS